MSEINVNQLLTQMKIASAQAQGKAPEAVEQAAGKEVPGFSEMLQQSIDKVSALQGESKRLSEAFELGDKSVSLAEVMIAKEKASVAFQSMVQVRNKLLEAYRDVTSMQL